MITRASRESSETEAWINTERAPVRTVPPQRPTPSNATRALIVAACVAGACFGLVAGTWVFKAVEKLGWI